MLTEARGVRWCRERLVRWRTDPMVRVLESGRRVARNSMHRPLPYDSDLARAIAFLARAQQDATWDRQQIANQLRSLLREYYPAALKAFATWQNGLWCPEARVLLAVAPAPTRAASLFLAQLRSALKRAGRVCGIEAEAQRLREVLRTECAQATAGRRRLGAAGARPAEAAGRRLHCHRRTRRGGAGGLFDSTRTLRSS